jgi:hypothetical protein
MLRRRTRRAQSAVEVMLLMPVIMMVFMAMYYLWSITFASANCHMRAREYALHGDTYLGGRAHGASGSSALDRRDYRKAERGLQSFEFSGTSRDTSIDGVGNSGVDISVTAVITSN